MIHTSCLIPLLHISKFFNLPSELTKYIYFYIINNSTQLIINKWYSYIFIHNTNLCYIANKIPLLQGHSIFGNTITYYDLQDKNFYITLSICTKYIKPSISDKDWWLNFAQNGYNGLSFINNNNNNNYINNIIKKNLSFIIYIFGCFK